MSVIPIRRSPAPTPSTFDAIYNATPGRTTFDATTIFDKLQIVRGGRRHAGDQLHVESAVRPHESPRECTDTDAIPGPNDRPFRSLGHAANGALPTSFYPAEKNGISSTPLNGVFDLTQQSNPYNKASLLRKMHNNLTTTSETYEVYLTVGFFDVLNSGPYYTAPNYVTPQLGKEVFRDVPGDTRHKYFAVVDRTNLSIDPNSATLTAVNGNPVYSTRKQGAKPVFTDVVSFTPSVATPTLAELKFTASAGFLGQGVTIRYDQTPDETNDFPVVVGTRLKIGTGVNAEWVQVSAVNGTVTAGGTLFDTNTGVATVTVTRNIGLPVSPTVLAAPYLISPLPVGVGAGQYPELPTHPPGSAISNVLLGNPGPQPGFDPTQPNYKAVMPYLLKLDQ